MPVMNGYEATARIREHELKGASRGAADMRAARVHIVAMTANATSGDREKCMEAGTDDYITKPLKRKELLAMVDKWNTAIADSKSEVQNPKSELENDPMDFPGAIEEFEGDEEFLMEVLEGFFKNVTSQIEIIRQAISEGDAEVVRGEAHSIKGGAANLMVDELSKIAFELENIGRSGALEKSIETLERLERELSRLEHFTKDRADLT